jgi:hypothetical protein
MTTANSMAFRNNTQMDRQVVAIVSVDPTSRTASGRTRIGTVITINCGFATGENIVTPAFGEQWYVERFDSEWRLYGRVPFNDATLLVEPKEGQVSVGSASGPVELNGTQINVRSPLTLAPVTDDKLPAADTVDAGTLINSASQGLVVSDGTSTDWTKVGAGAKGDKGDTGDTGPTGPVGVNWRGTWNSSTAYATNDGVFYNGSSYRATSDIASGASAPDINPGWTLIAQKGAAGGGGTGSLPPGGTSTDYLAGDDADGGVWQPYDAISQTILTTKGDLLTATGPGSLVRQGVGTDGQALLADSTQTDGLRWGAVSASGVSGVFDPSQLPLLADLLGILNPSQVPGLDASKIISGVFGSLLIPLLDASKVITGVFDPGQIPALQLLSGLLNPAQLPLLNALLGTLTGSQLGGIDASKIVSGQFSMTQILGLLDALASAGGPIIDTIVNTFLGLGSSGYTTTDLARALQSMPGQFIGGTLNPGLFSNLNVAALSAVLPELLTNPNFDSPNALVGQYMWTWDGTTGPPGGVTSVYVIADGTVKELFSNPINVNAGQTLNISGKTKWSTFTGTADSIALTVAQYTPGGVLFPTQPYQTIGSIASPGSSGGWITLSAAYTVPTGVAMIVLRPLVTNGAVGGKVWFGQCSVKPAGTNMGAQLVPLLDASKIISGIFDISTIPTTMLGLANIGDLQTLSDYITNALIGSGSQFSGTDLTQAEGSMVSIYEQVIDAIKTIQSMQANNISINVVQGVLVNIDFSNYPNGPLPSMFTVTYTGPGTSTQGIVKGNAQWVVGTNAARTATVLYNVAPTATDWQLIGGSMATAPSGGGVGGPPRIWVIGRSDAAGNNFVWARGYCTGFLTYKGDIGCTVAGVETVWATAISFGWNMSIQLVCGVNNNPREYQVFAGTTLVYDYVEVGTTSMMGPSYRYWGSRTEIKAGSTPVTCGAIAGASVTDNAPPASLGSTFRTQRLSTSTVSLAAGSNIFPSNFFDTVDRQTADYTWSATTNVLTVNTSGTFIVNARYALSSMSGHASAGVWQSTLGGPFVLQRSAGLIDQSGAIAGTCLIYCTAGDKLAFGSICSAAGTALGDAAGIGTYVEVALANRSLA